MAGNGYVYAGVTRWRGGTRSGVYRCAVGVHDWEECNTGFPEDIHVQAVVVHPQDAATVLAGTNDGPYLSRDFGKTWQRTDFPERNRQIWSVHFDPSNPKTAFAGASPVEVFKSEDGGESWASIASSKLPPRFDTGKFVNRVMRLAVDPSNSQTVFGGCEVNGMMRSLDGGKTWEDDNDELYKMVDQRPELESAILTPVKYEGMMDIHSLTCSRAAPDTAFSACRLGVFCTRDRGDTWEDMKIGRFSPYTYGRDIKVSPHDPSKLYACVSVASHGDTGAIFWSPDLGETWARFDNSVKALGTMMAVSPHPGDPNRVYAATRAGQVFCTPDAGKTWEDHPLPKGCDGVYSLATSA